MPCLDLQITRVALRSCYKSHGCNASNWELGDTFESENANENNVFSEAWDFTKTITRRMGRIGELNAIREFMNNRRRCLVVCLHRPCTYLLLGAGTSPTYLMVAVCLYKNFSGSSLANQKTCDPKNALKKGPDSPTLELSPIGTENQGWLSMA